jgi:probable addiction module antidote protein
MPKMTRSFREQLLKDLADPAEAAHYINAALDDSAEEDSQEMLLVALRDVAESWRMSAVANEAGVSRESVYRMLSKHGNPTYRSLAGILKALDLRLSVSPISRADLPLPNDPTSTAAEHASSVLDISNALSPPNVEVSRAQYSMGVKMGIAAGVVLGGYLTLVPYNGVSTPDYGYVVSPDPAPLALFDIPSYLVAKKETENQGDFSSARG